MRNGFGNAAKPATNTLKPRAMFTVEAIYEAFVRIWQRDGWAALTTRAVSLEAGVAVGTLYDYFPSKEALLSGYVRHRVEYLLQQLDEQVTRPRDLDWRTRVERLIRLSVQPVVADQPLFDYEMLRLEHQIAESKHHQRVFQELSQAWKQAFAACTDLTQQPSAEQIDAWLVLAWGGRRYCLTTHLSAAAIESWLTETQALICQRLEKQQ